MSFGPRSSPLFQAAPRRPEGARAGKAILAADAVGYSRLMGQDEEATLRRLHEYRRLFTDTVTGHGGAVFGVAGDSEMAVFDDACEAVRCALRLQEAIGTRNAVLPKESRMPIRVGVNFGPVIMDGDDVYGDDVNIAARLEGFAEAGEVCVSESVFELTRGKLECGFDSFGRQTLKNINRPVRIYRLRADPQAIGQVVSAKRRRPRPGRRWRLAAAVFLVALLGATTWGLRVQTEKRQAEAAAEKLIVETRRSVDEAQDQIERLIGQLQRASDQAADNGRRVDALVALLQEAQNAAADQKHLSRRHAAELGRLLKHLESSEDRAAAERARADTLLAALQELRSSGVGLNPSEARLTAREPLTGMGRGPEFRQFPTDSWREAGRPNQEAEPPVEAQLIAATDAEAMALTEQRAAGEAAGRDETDARVSSARDRMNNLLATLQEAQRFVAGKRRQALGLRDRLLKAQRGVANDAAAEKRLQDEVARVAGLLSTLDSLEARIAEEISNIERTLQSVAVAGAGQRPSVEQPQPRQEPTESGIRSTPEIPVRADRSRLTQLPSNRPQQEVALPSETFVLSTEESAGRPEARAHAGGPMAAPQTGMALSPQDSLAPVKANTDAVGSSVGEETRSRIASAVEGHWVGVGLDMAGVGPYCPARLVLEFDVADGGLTGRNRGLPQPLSNAVSGSVDGTGKFMIRAGNAWFGLKTAEGQLDGLMGRGTGRWFGRDCTGTLTLTKVE